MKALAAVALSVMLTMPALAVDQVEKAPPTARTRR